MFQPMIQGGVLKSDTFTNVTVGSTGAATILIDSTNKKIVVGIVTNDSSNSFLVNCAYVKNSKTYWWIRCVKVENGVLVPNTAISTISGTYYYIETD